MSIPIDEQYEKPLLDKVTNPKLHNNLLSIREAVAGLWTGSPLVRDFTDHGPGHNSRLLKYTAKLLACNKGQQLNQEELYVLIASTYLHDIGMQADVVKRPDLIERAEFMGAQFEVGFTAPTTSQYSSAEQDAIRENHHWLSAAWIEHALDSDEDTAFNRAMRDIPRRVAGTITDIISCHSKRDIAACEDTFYYYNGKQRKRLLAVLLRLADEMDIASDRVNIEIMKEYRLPSDSALWWWLHYCTELGLDDNGVLTIQVSVNRQDHETYAWKVKQLIVDRFMDKNYPLIDLLFKAGIHVHFDLESGVEAGHLEALPEGVKVEIDRRLGPSEKPWDWLRNHQPASYEQLIEKLEEASESLSSSGQTELRQLAEVFRWCGEHEIGLAELQIPRHLPKYREAAAYTSRIIGSDESSESRIGRMREAVERIKSDPDRDTTRAWARESRTEPAKGCQFILEDESAGLLILGPAATIQKTHERVAKEAPWIEWDLSIEDALVEIQRAGQADEGG